MKNIIKGIVMAILIIGALSVLNAIVPHDTEIIVKDVKIGEMKPVSHFNEDETKLLVEFNSDIAEESYELRQKVEAIGYTVLTEDAWWCDNEESTVHFVLSTKEGQCWSKTYTNVVNDFA